MNPGVTGRSLGWLARYGRLVLVAGLIAGLALPGLAQAMRPHLPLLVAVLLFVSALRVGHRAVFGQVTHLGRPLAECLVLQLALPLAAIALLRLIGVDGTAAGLAVIFMLAAPSVTGAPNFTILVGHDPAPAMQVLITGTALFPITVIPVFWLLGPEALGEISLAASVGGLIVVILGAVALGFLARQALLPAPTQDQLHQLDGLAAILLAVVVVGLMTGIGPLLEGELNVLAGWLVLAFGMNFGFQSLSFLALRSRTPRVVPLSIISGNRNIALFLVALPPDIVDQLLPFIGCYQLPMYLTPILLARLHR